jgi:hypothetical protein
MSEEMNKTKLLEEIQAERAALEATLENISPVAMLQPGVIDNWTVKDILAHIVDWEQRMVRWVEITLRGEMPEEFSPGMTWTDEDVDKLNQESYLAQRDKTLDVVLAEFRDSYALALEMAKKPSKEQLLDPNYYDWRSNPLWYMVAANTSWHYKEHNEQLTEWLG